MLPILILKYTLPYLLPFFFIVFVALSESYRLRDAVKYSNEWHRYKGLYQATFFTLLACFDFWFACVCASMFWIIHDIIINVFGFSLYWYHIGTTAKSDRIFGSFWVQFLVKVLTLVVFVCGWLGMYRNLFDFLT